MEYCGAGSVSDIMKLRNKTVSIGGHKNMRLRRLPTVACGMFAGPVGTMWTIPRNLTIKTKQKLTRLLKKIFLKVVCDVTLSVHPHRAS